MTGASLEAQPAIPSSEEVHENLGRRSLAALGAYDMILRGACCTLRLPSVEGSAKFFVLIGMVRPEDPFEALSISAMSAASEPLESVTMDHVRPAISLARRPARTERRKIRRFREGCLVVAR